MPLYVGDPSDSASAFLAEGPQLVLQTDALSHHHQHCPLHPLHAAIVLIVSLYVGDPGG